MSSEEIARYRNIVMGLFEQAFDDDDDEEVIDPRSISALRKDQYLQQVMKMHAPWAIKVHAHGKGDDTFDLEMLDDPRGHAFPMTPNAMFGPDPADHHTLVTGVTLWMIDRDKTVICVDFHQDLPSWRIPTYNYNDRIFQEAFRGWLSSLTGHEINDLRIEDLSSCNQSGTGMQYTSNTVNGMMQDLLRQSGRLALMLEAVGEEDEDEDEDEDTVRNMAVSQEISAVMRRITALGPVKYIMADSGVHLGHSITLGFPVPESLPMQYNHLDFVVWRLPSTKRASIIMQVGPSPMEHDEAGVYRAMEIPREEAEEIISSVMGKPARIKGQDVYHELVELRLVQEDLPAEWQELARVFAQARFPDEIVEHITQRGVRDDD